MVLSSIEPLSDAVYVPVTTTTALTIRSTARALPVKMKGLPLHAGRIMVAGGGAIRAQVEFSNDLRKGKGVKG